MQLERFARAVTGASLLLALCASGCDDEARPAEDAGQLGDARAVGGGAAEAGAADACAPSDCVYHRFPLICPPGSRMTIVCERVVSGAVLGGCAEAARCDLPADAGSGSNGSPIDAGSAPDAGPAPDAGSSPGGGTGVGKTCGGIAGLSCAAGLFCDYAAGTGCNGVSDASGVCASMPQGCGDKYEPVCGCNTRSYPSPCEANRKGASVKHAGLCTADECTSSGGRTVYSDGASTPTCHTGEVSFDIPGKEPALCCVAGP